MTDETFDYVIVGGGIVGCAVAYYLSKQNAGRVIVLERNQIAQANTSRAAGLLTRARSKPPIIPMAQETYTAIRDIEELTHDSLGLKVTGSIHAAALPEYQKKLFEMASLAIRSGLQVEWLSTSEIADFVPWLKMPRDSSVIYMPDEGYIDGYRLASGYLKAARIMGVELREDTTVLEIQRSGDAVLGVRTNRGNISSRVVIDAAGAWAIMLAWEIGIGLPLAPVRSQYWFTSAHLHFTPDQPFVMLPDANAYTRPEARGIIFGLRESPSVVVGPRELPEQLSGYRFKEDPDGWDSLVQGLPSLARFFPLVEEVGITSYVSGFSTYTPDGMFVLGELPGINGFIAATGCNGAGIAASGGIGRAAAEMATGAPPHFELDPHRPDRFGAINPLEADFQKQCGLARSRKASG